MKSSLISGASALFPLGCPRSGTTFLARLLNAHPEILTTYETAVFLQLNHRIITTRPVPQDAKGGASSHRQLWTRQLAQESRELIEGYYEEVARIEGKRSLAYWGDKHPHHAQNHCLDFIEGLYPDARFIYIVRDPRDAACSIAAMRACDFEEAMTIWSRLSGLYEAFLAGRQDRVQTLRYEDLVAQPTLEAHKLIGGLGLTWHTDVDGFLAMHAAHDVHATGLERHRRRDFSNHSVGRWRREVTPEEGKLAERMAGDFMERYGYANAPSAPC